jgi:hypothetical protein
VSRSRAVARSIGAVGVAAALLISAGGASGAPHVRTVVAKKPPPGISGQFYDVSAVPHSTDVWAAGNDSTGNVNFFALRHHGKWHKVNPGMGQGGKVLGIAAGSTKAAWAVGQTSSFAPTDPQSPRLTQWNGKKFTTVALAGTNSNVSAVAASSASNAWAVGNLRSAVDETSQVAAHWNGKRWSMVPLPSTLGGTGLVAVSTSSASNAWAIGIDATGHRILLQWNGKTWKVGATAPLGVGLTSVATSSSKHAVAGGTQTTTKRSNTYLMSFNGRKWVHVKAPNPGIGAVLTAVTMSGKSAWAVGYASKFIRVGGQPFDELAAITLHSSGGKWTSQPDAVGQGVLNGVSAESPKQVYAVGARGLNPDYSTSFSIYNGHKWAVEPAKP